MFSSPYLRRLTFWAYLLLDSQEAEEVVEDYSEIIQNHSDSDPQQQFGSPCSVICKLLTAKQLIQRILFGLVLLFLAISPLMLFSRTVSFTAAILLLAVQWGFLQYTLQRSKDLAQTQPKKAVALHFLMQIVLALLLMLLCGWIFFTFPMLQVGPSTKGVLAVACAVFTVSGFAYTILSLVRCLAWARVSLVCFDAAVCCTLFVSMMAQLSEGGFWDILVSLSFVYLMGLIAARTLRC